MPTRTEKLTALAYGVGAYISFAATIAYLIAFVADLGVPKTVDTGAGPLGPALLIDILLIALFGVQHSVMARPGFKRWLARALPPQLERSTFVLASSAALALLYWLWRPMPALIWEVSGPAAAVGLWGLYGLGWVVAIAATFALSHPRLFGLSQVAEYLEGRETPSTALRTPTLYRVVRHPMTAGIILMFWAAPRMTLGRLVLSLGMTLYCLIGTYFEERDLVRALGERYRAYRLRVPALLPIPRPGGSLRAGYRAAALAVALVGTLGLGAARILGHADAGSPGPVRGRILDDSLRADGRQRHFAYYLPTTRAAERPPLILAFHGSGGSGERLRAFLGGELERLAEREGFVAVYPQGFEGSWNGCRGPAPSAANRLAVDDVAFVQALVERLAREVGTEAERAYAIGFSGGGHMAYRLALEIPEQVPAVAAIGASLPVEEEIDCRPSGRSVSVMIVNGTADPVSPYAGGEVVAPAGARLGRVRSARETGRYFGALFGGAAVPTRTRTVVPREDGTTGVELTSWANASVLLYTVVGGGHTIPGPRSRMPGLLGATERRFSAVDEAVRFLLTRDPATAVTVGASSAR